MPRLIRSTSSSPNVLGQELAVEMLGRDVADLAEGRPPAVLSLVKAELRRRRDAMAEVLRRADLTLVTRTGGVPQGGISLLARLPADLEDDLAVIDRAIDTGRFSAIPGSAFGAPGCIRFGYAGIPLAGIARLGTALPAVLEEVRSSPAPAG
jgi:aspartate/methionine/tyrosine aminotransferase